MIARLKLAGIRSLSVLVDITNYVMLELGQPIHGYDLDRLQGGIVVRRATPGEKLDHARRQGAHARTSRTWSSPTTAAPSASAASWAAPRPRWASPRATCSSRRPTGTPSPSRAPHAGTSCRARRRSATSAASTPRSRRPRCPGSPSSWSTSRAEPPTLGGSLIHEAPARTAILLPDGYVSGLIGVEYHDDEVHDALAEIGGIVTRVDGGFEVVPPSWRPDLTGRAELAEEVARLAGYHRIPSVLPVAPPGRGLTRSQRIRRRVADTLAAAGSTEVLSFPFATGGRERRLRQRRRRARGIRAARERARREHRAPAAVAAARAHRRGEAQPLARARGRVDLRARQRVPARDRPDLRLGRSSRSATRDRATPSSRRCRRASRRSRATSACSSSATS